MSNRAGEADVRHVVMFSSGAGSAMAAKRVAERHGTADLVLLFADVNGEHPDNYRFLLEAARWVGGELVILTNDGMTIWDAFRKARFLGNSRIDPCSRMLKREPMRKWLDKWCDPESTVVHLGFDWTEEHRMERARPHWVPWTVESPLMWEPVMDKAEGMAAMTAAGVLPPLLTRMGFPHANCAGGCVKAGHKHFRKLLMDLPDEFTAWESNEVEMQEFLGTPVTILRSRIGGASRPMPLSELRAEVEAETDGSLFADDDWGGCNCFTPPDEEGADVA